MDFFPPATAAGAELVCLDAAAALVETSFGGAAGEGAAGVGDAAREGPLELFDVEVSIRWATADLGIAMRPASGDRITSWVLSSERKSPVIRSPFDSVTSRVAADTRNIVTSINTAAIEWRRQGKRCPHPTGPDSFA